MIHRRHREQRTSYLRSVASSMVEQLEQRVLLSATDAIIVTQPWVTGTTDAAHATTSTDTATPTTVTIRAGQPLFVSAVGAYDSQGNKQTGAQTFSVAGSDPLNVGYAWDFGDSGSKYDKLPGFSASHVYDMVGTYNVKLTLTEGPLSSPTVYQSAPLQVDVTPWTSTVYYVSNVAGAGGSDSNNGTSAATPFLTLAPIINGFSNHTIGSNTTIEIQGGGSPYAMSTWFDLCPGGSALHDITIRSFDPSAKATLDGSNLTFPPGYTPSWIHTSGDGPGEENYMFEDLSFVGSSNNEQDVTILGGQNFALRRCTFKYVKMVAHGGGVNQNAGLLMQDCSVPADGTMGDAFAFLNGTDEVLLGNYVNGSLGENVIRMQTDQGSVGTGATRVLIYDNSLFNGNLGIGKANVAFQVGAFAYVASNQLTDDHQQQYGGLQFGPLMKQRDQNNQTPTPTELAEKVVWAVADGNTFHDADIQVFSGSAGVELRNNVFNQTRNTCIIVYDSDANWKNSTSDIRILNNTGFYSGTGSYFISVQIPEYGSVPPLPALDDELYYTAPKSTAGITLVDNLYVAPNITTGFDVDVENADLNCFDLVAGNLWQERVPSATNPTLVFEINHGHTTEDITTWNRNALLPSGTPSDNRVTSGSSVVGGSSTDYTPGTASATLVKTGVTGYTVFGANYSSGRFYPGVRSDYFGNPRPTSGAVTVGAAQIPPPPPAGLEGAESGGSATLTWLPSDAANASNVDSSGNPKADVVEYNIYRNSDQSPLATVTGTTYTDASPPAGEVTYRVTAIDAGGNESSAATVNVEPPTPAAASGLVAAPLSDTTIRLAWIDNSNNETGFEIMRGADGINFTLLATAPAGTQMYDDSSLTAGTVEYYEVVATNNGLNAAASNVSSATTWLSATSAPVRIYSYQNIVVFTDSQGNSWDPDYENTYGSGGSISMSSFPVAGVSAYDAELYYMQRQGNSSSPDLSYAIPAANGTYSLELLFAEPDSSMTAGGRVFNVTAEGATVLNNFDIVADIGAPQTADIKEMRVNVTDGELNLQFTHDIGYPVISSIALVPAPSLTSVDIGTSTIGSTSVVTDDVAYNLTGNGQVNNNADSLHFAYETITGDFDFATQVTSLTNANAYTLASLMARADLAPGSAQVTIGARASASNGFRFNARPTDNATTDAGYEVGTLADYPYTWIRLTRVDNVFTGYYSVGQQPNGIVWTTIGQETVSLPQTVYFGLAASSYTSGLATATFNDFTAAPTPAAATNLIASPADELKIHLSWTDNSNNETGFKIMRSTDGGSTYSLLTTVQRNTQSYDDATVVNGQQYYYEVIATNTYSDAAPSNAANCWAIPTPVLSSVVEQDSNGHPNFTLNWGEHDSNGNYVSYPNDGSYGYQSTDIMHIYWSADNGATWNLYYYDSTYPVSAQPGTKFINDPGITQVDNIQMVFRIQAENAQGQLSQMSNWFWPNT